MRSAFAWLGGATFAAALVYFVYFHAVVLGRPAEGALSPAGASAVNAALFSAFALHHSIMARSGAKAWLTRLVPASLERSLYVWIASLLFLAVCLAWQPLPGVVYRAEGLVEWLLRGGQLAGLWFTFRGASVVDPLELAGIRQASGRERPVEFKIAGPFRLVRHPIYLGWVLMVFCPPSMTASRLLFAVVSTAYLVVAIPFEERSLVQQFGERYRAYQRAVRSRLIPFVW